MTGSMDIPGIWTAAYLALLALWFTVVIAAFVSIAASKRLSQTERAVWFVVVIAAPLAGGAAWFALAFTRRAHDRRAGGHAQ